MTNTCSWIGGDEWDPARRPRVSWYLNSYDMQTSDCRNRAVQDDIILASGFRHTIAKYNLPNLSMETCQEIRRPALTYKRSPNNEISKYRIQIMNPGGARARGLDNPLLSAGHILTRHESWIGATRRAQRSRRNLSYSSGALVQNLTTPNQTSHATSPLTKRHKRGRTGLTWFFFVIVLILREFGDLGAC